MLNQISKFSRKINQLEGQALTLILIIMNLAIFHDILTRYMGIPSLVLGCEEIARISLVWFAFLGASYAYANHAHPSIDIFIARLNIKSQKIIAFINYCFIIFFLLVMVVFGLRFALRGMAQIYPVIGIKLFWSFISIPLSGMLMIIHTIGGLKTNKDK